MKLWIFQVLVPTGNHQLLLQEISQCQRNGGLRLEGELEWKYLRKESDHLMNIQCERVWVDTTALAEIPKPREIMAKLIGAGYQLVISNDAIESPCFQEKPAWFEMQLKKQGIVCEVLEIPSKMADKQIQRVARKHKCKLFLDETGNVAKA